MTFIINEFIPVDRSGFTLIDWFLSFENFDADFVALVTFETIKIR